MLKKALILILVTTTVVTLLWYSAMVFVNWSFDIGLIGRVLLVLGTLLALVLISVFFFSLEDKTINEAFDTLTCARDTFMEQECTKENK